MHAGFGGRTDIVSAEERVLRQLDGEIAVVVVHKNLDRIRVAQNGLQFLEVHLDAAVSGDADDFASGRRRGGSDGGGKVVAH